MRNKTLRIGTLFSGIGAFEAALKQLQIPHEIRFACDNGEIEFIPLDNKDKKEYKLQALFRQFSTFFSTKK